MRLFIALSVSSEISTYLHTFDSRIRACLHSTLVSDIHLTLKFLGEVRDPSDILAKLGTIHVTPFELFLVSFGVFPRVQNPRVFWVGVEPHDTVLLLQKAITQALFPAFPKEHFFAHLTLARIKSVSDHVGFQKLLSEPLEKRSFTVSSFELIQSTLTPEGPIYRTLATFS